MRTSTNSRTVTTCCLQLAIFLLEVWTCVCGPSGELPELDLEGFLDFEIVYPEKVDEYGFSVSSHLSPSGSRIYKRHLNSIPDSPVYYKVHHKGQDLRFNISVSRSLLAPGFITERRRGGVARAKIQTHTHGLCHYSGKVEDPELHSGLAAISTCSGMKGVFQLYGEDYFIEPLKGSQLTNGKGQPHVIYKRHVPENAAEQTVLETNMDDAKKQQTTSKTCGTKDAKRTLKHSEKRREKWEQRQKRQRIKQRSISKEKWVETLVVADTKMVEYHGSENIENYVLTVMNMVASLFHDASIGNAIHIVVVRLILLEEEEEDLKIIHHADNTLSSFCKWQKKMNIKEDSHPTHHDVAVLLTRKDLCAAMNKPCETLGLSHVSGMCQPHRSCNINEDTGLPLAFTVAHELGHSFGIQHDGTGNDCEPIGKRPFVMSPQLLYNTSPLTWSRCSREYITRFLDRGWGLCLDDPPTKNVVEFPSILPGVLYDVSHQCQLQYGSESSFCDEMDDVCNTLWCTVGNTCHSKLDAAVDGTTCGENKWCFDRECVPVGYYPGHIDGGWGAWSSWNACTRTCGAGVQNAERQCNNPVPKYGGRYCLGERKRYRICNIKPCPNDKSTFRHIQCSQFDAMPYKGKLYKWLPVPNTINPCALHCRPAAEYFSEKLLDAVVDGTPCYEGSTSKDVCINGICKNVGCDYEIDSNAIEDQCGVCHGNGSTCETVKKMFEESEGLGYVDIGLIPEGARDIRIEEVAEAGNFLALRSEDPEKYFLNGGWTIQWHGDYKVAGTTFTYERNGNWENLTSPGPTREPVWIQLLFQEKNPGVRYQYTVRREYNSMNEILPLQFFWLYGSWTECSATCGTGVQRQIVHCIEKIAGIVEERYCDPLTRPDDNQRNCNEDACPARWWVGEWQKCSATCGTTGLMKRTVLCIQSVKAEEQRALEHSECEHIPKPDITTLCNGHIPCPSDWAVGNWSECSVTCGQGIQQRDVYCSNHTGFPCDSTFKPASNTICSLDKCPSSKLDSFSPGWSGSGASSKESYNEIDYILNNHIPNINPRANRKFSSEEEGNSIIDYYPANRNNDRPKNNIFVDDFYYDYNFINFHEDLSYEPNTEHEDKHGEPKTNVEVNENNVPDVPISGPFEEKEDVTQYSLKTTVLSDRVNNTSKSYTTEMIHQDETTTFSASAAENSDSMDFTSPSSFKMTVPVSIEYHGIKFDDADSPYGHIYDIAKSNETDNTNFSLDGQTVTESPQTQRETFITSTDGDSLNNLYMSDPTHSLLVMQSDNLTDPGMTMHNIVNEDYFDNNGSFKYQMKDFSQVDNINNDNISEMGPADLTEESHHDTPFTQDVINIDDLWRDHVTYTELDGLVPFTSENESNSDETEQDTALDNDLSKNKMFPSTSHIIASDNHHSGQQPEYEKEQNVHLKFIAEEAVGRGVTPELVTVRSYATSGDHVTAGLTPVIEQASTETQMKFYSEIVYEFTKELPEETNITKKLNIQNLDSDFSTVLDDFSYTIDHYHLPEHENSITVTPVMEHALNTPTPSQVNGSAVIQQGYGERSTLEPPLNITYNKMLTAVLPTLSQQDLLSIEIEDIGMDDSFKHSLQVTTPKTQSYSNVNEALLQHYPLGRSDEEHTTNVFTSSDARTWNDSIFHFSPKSTTDYNQSVSEVTPLNDVIPEVALSPPYIPLLRVFWKVENWSECSTTCGLGAVWRTVHCNTGNDGDCDITKKPAPARRCYLRPCSMWQVGNWSKCSKNCGGGVTLREVQCIDSRDQRPLRPFHCQALQHKPIRQMSCNSEPCLDWYTSSWSECSEMCGEGDQHRLVMCPETGQCDQTLQPNDTKACYLLPCTKWVTGSWGMCSASCGGGIQRRLVKCINIKTGQTEEDNSHCDHEPWPENTQKCNTQECEISESNTACGQDRLTFSFCQTLKFLASCDNPHVKSQCCHTCRSHNSGIRERGNERVSRR
ncbi:A disintegrin and metalloproteinase with thrombospondin motifs 7-like [Protopterus annectens]|uniref:A disintegrin and metalloproteinase with thrombospondin motifs 7-like n=1 Tax=Protopterus annectens TaxID=7888 RepID=UPI001CFB32CB|nr:A disintegrin and metalloproteinase with thrombospondin motifs 7-like [Protopterus annectens]